MGYCGVVVGVWDSYVCDHGVVLGVKISSWVCSVATVSVLLLM